MSTFLNNLASIATILALVIAVIVYWEHIKKLFQRKNGRDDQDGKNPPKGTDGPPWPPLNGILEFDKNEQKQQYQDWLKQYPHGFVINTPRNKPANNMILHKATCGHMNRIDSIDGAFIKIASEQVDNLPIWMKQNGNADGKFSGACGICHPIPSDSPLIRQKEAKQ